MRSAFGLCSGLVALGWLLGCGANVTFGDGDGSGASGAGGSGAAPPVNPSDCPLVFPGIDDCSQVGLECRYDEEGCVVTYTCEVDFYWSAISADCTFEVVDCEIAQAGDRCALPGDACIDFGDCSEEDKYCGADHLWSIDAWGDECCYDECCEPYECPASLPMDGDYCDPCFELPDCYYQVETECGVASAHAMCDSKLATWTVEQPVCDVPQPG